MTLKLNKFSIKGTRIKDINLSLDRGCGVFLMGSDDVSKFLLLREIYEQSDRSTGTIYFDDLPMTKEKIRIQLVPANEISFNIKRKLAEILDDTYLMPSCIKDWRKEIINFPNLFKIIEYPAEVLTLEEKKCISYFRALLFEPELFLCEELLPLIEFDKDQKLLYEIKRLKKDSLVIFSSYSQSILLNNNIHLLLDICDIFIFIIQNSLIVMNSRNDVLKIFFEIDKLLNTPWDEYFEGLLQDFTSSLLLND